MKTMKIILAVALCALSPLSALGDPPLVSMSSPAEDPFAKVTIFIEDLDAMLKRGETNAVTARLEAAITDPDFSTFEKQVLRHMLTQWRANVKNSEMNRTSSEVDSPTSSAQTSSADEIIAKAENHDGIVLGGFYLGMSPEDALVLCKHYFGHLGTVKLNRVVWKDYLDGGYTIRNNCVEWRSGHSPANHSLRVEPYEGIVLVRNDGKYQAICGIGKQSDYGPSNLRYSAERVNFIRFDSKMIRAITGQKKVMASSKLGQTFFRTFDLDGDVFMNDDIEFKTPERETVIYINEKSTVFFGFDLDRNCLGRDQMFHVEYPEGDHWW